MNLVNLKFELVFLQSICLRVRACVCVSVREKVCRFSEYVCDVSLVVWVCLRDYNYKCVLSKYWIFSTLLCYLMVKLRRSKLKHVD